MAFTYDLSTDIGKVRLRIPDTVDSGHLFEDDEITALLTAEGSVLSAAAGAVEILARDRSRLPRVLGMGAFKTEREAVESLLALAKQLRSQAINPSGLVTAELQQTDDKMGSYLPEWRDGSEAN